MDSLTAKIAEAAAGPLPNIAKSPLADYDNLRPLLAADRDDADGRDLSWRKRQHVGPLPTVFDEQRIDPSAHVHQCADAPPCS